MKTLAVVSRKGGSGKTTIAGHLAVAAERAGDGPVALVDTDPQASLADWWNSRRASAPLFVQTSFDRLESDCVRLEHAGVKWLIIDTPPAISEAVETCVNLADMVVIPSRPSPHDIRSVASTVDLVEHLGKPLMFVINAAVGRAKITGEAISFLSKHGPIAPAILGQRVDFAASMIDGRTVMELPGNSRSAEEVCDLWSYLSARVHGEISPVRAQLPKPRAGGSQQSQLFAELQSA